jgi:hypothetical protein
MWGVATATQEGFIGLAVLGLRGPGEPRKLRLTMATLSHTANMLVASQHVWIVEEVITLRADTPCQQGGITWHCVVRPNDNDHWICQDLDHRPAGWPRGSDSRPQGSRAERSYSEQVSALAERGQLEAAFDHAS